MDPTGTTFISSYKSCTSSCTGADKKCYRIGSSNSCESNTYHCGDSAYSDIVSSNCASAGSYKYSSLANCQANICTPDNSAVSSTCSTSYFTNNCGKIIQGTKDCTGLKSNGNNGSSTSSGFALALTYSDWKQSTAATRLTTGCSVSENCLPYEDLSGTGLNYTVSCKGSAQLVNQLKEDSKSVCSKYEQYGITWLVGIAACTGTVAATFIFPPAVAAVIPVCGVSLAGGIALSATEKIAAITCSGLKSNAITGACIAVPVYTYPVQKFLSGMAFFSITNDPVIDGAIILVAIILLGAIVINKL
jgi:hypothetical protein